MHNRIDALADEVRRLEEERCMATRQVKRLSLIRDRAESNLFELEQMDTNPARRDELLEDCRRIFHQLDAELLEAYRYLEDVETDKELSVDRYLYAQREHARRAYG